MIEMERIVLDILINYLDRYLSPQSCDTLADKSLHNITVTAGPIGWALDTVSHDAANQ